MSSDRRLLHTLVDSLPESEIAVALSFLSELGEEEQLDPETADKLDRAKSEVGEDVPIDLLRRQLGL
jgi:hypothetical protein